MNVDEIATLLAPSGVLARDKGAVWLSECDFDVRIMAQLMRDNESRFVTLSVVPDRDGFRFVYHWDVDGEIVCLTKCVAGNEAVSIADILPATDWIEREAHDYFGIEFVNRADTPPLVLREGDQPGFFGRTVEVTKDPADSGWSREIGLNPEATS